MESSPRWSISRAVRASSATFLVMTPPEMCIRDSAPPEAVRTLLAGVEHITHSAWEARESGLWTVRVQTDCGDIYQVSRSIFFAFAGAGKALLELSVKKASLEDVFLELTEQDESETAEKEAAEG